MSDQKKPVIVEVDDADINWDALALEDIEIVGGQSTTGGAGSYAKDVGKGLAQGAAQTVTDIARLAPKLFGAPDPTAKGGAMGDIAAFAESATTDGQKLGKGIEQAAEFVLPGMAGEKAATFAGKAVPMLAKGPLRVATRMGTNSAVSGAHAGLHGQDPVPAALAGAAFTGVGEAGAGVARWIGRQAKPLIKSGLKLTDAELAAQATAKRKGLAGEQDEVAEFLLDKRWQHADQAEARLKEIETARNAGFAASTKPLNPAQEAHDALDALAARARKRSDGGVALLAAIEKERKRLVAGPLYKPGAAKPAPAQPIIAQGGGFSSTASGTAAPPPAHLLPGSSQPAQPIVAPPKPNGVAVGTTVTGTPETQALGAGNVRSVKPAFRVSQPTGTSFTIRHPQSVTGVQSAGSLPAQPGVSAQAPSSVQPPATPVPQRTQTSMTPAALTMNQTTPPVPTPITGRAAAPGGRIAPKRVMRDDVTATELKEMVELDAEDLKGLWGKQRYPVLKAKNKAHRKQLIEAAPDPDAMRALNAESGMAQRAKSGLDRMHKRQDNREVLSLPLKIGMSVVPSAAVGGGMAGGATGAATAAVATTSMAIAAHLLRNNPVKAGYRAKDLAAAVAANKPVVVAQILQKLGIGSIAEATAPDDIPREGNMTVTGGKP
jgi:hypothetical protein